MGQGAWNGLTEAINPIAALCEIGKIAVGLIGRALHDKVTTGKIDIGNITREVLYDRYGGRPEPKPARQPVVNTGTQSSLIEKTKVAIIPSPRSSVVPTVSRRDPKAGCERNVSGTGKGYDYGSVTPTSSLLDRWQDRWADQNTMMGDLAMAAMVAGGLSFGAAKAGKAISTIMKNQKNLVGVAGKVPGQVLGQGGSNKDLVTVYRGSNLYAEKQVYEETGLVMSDAARHHYLSTANLKKAYATSRATHKKWIKLWGDQDTYVQAHGEFGTELSKAFDMDRTMVSVTKDPKTAQYFAGDNGYIYTLKVPAKDLVKQTLKGAGESEYLILNGTKRRR